MLLGPRCRCDVIVGRGLEFRFFSHPTKIGRIRDIIPSPKTFLLSFAFRLCCAMSLLLASTTVSAVVCLSLSINLISRTRACLHGVEKTASTAYLSVTLCYPDQAVTTALPFVITDDDIWFEVVFGQQWDRWCRENNGEPLICVLCSFSIILAVISPLSSVELPPDVSYNHFISPDLHNVSPQPHKSSEWLLTNDMSSNDTFPSSWTSKGFPLPSSSCTKETQLSSSRSGHSILHDMFLSRRDTGIRASIFHCPEDHIRSVCLLHVKQMTKPGCGHCRLSALPCTYFIKMDDIGTSPFARCQRLIFMLRIFQKYSSRADWLGV
jgi:hypothetical protein